MSRIVKWTLQKIGILIVTLLTILSSLHAQQQNKIDSLVFTKFYSKNLNEERKIVVHLPLNYIKEPARKYPVMYVLNTANLLLQYLAQKDLYL